MAALLAVVLFSGCVFDRKGMLTSDAVREARPFDLQWDRSDPDLPFDATVPDTTPPDITPPDTQPPILDTQPYHVWEDFSQGWGSVGAKTGSWSIDASAATVTQSTVNANGRFAYVDVQPTDYIAETALVIHKHQGLDNISEGAGLSVRVQAAVVNPGYPPDQYACVISNDYAQLGVWECSNQNQVCNIKTATPISYVAGTKYRLRATVIGNKVTCELPDLGKSVSMTDNSLSSGGVALSTFYASATFYYLKVWAP
jgi:hypothetical protein